MSSIYGNNSLLEYFRPRGKIVCVGDSLRNEIRLLNDFLSGKAESRLPLLLLAPSTLPSDMCDQVVLFDSEDTLSQVQYLLNSYFLIFVFNSSENGVFRVLENILRSIKYSDSIPIFVDTGSGLQPQNISLLGANYFNFDFSVDNNRSRFLMFFSAIMTNLNSSEGLNVSFSDLIQIFGNSKALYWSISTLNTVEETLQKTIDELGDKLVSALPEDFESLEILFITIVSKNPVTLVMMNHITQKLTNTFGKEFEIRFTTSTDSLNSDYTILLLLTDYNPIKVALPSFCNIEEEMKEDRLISSTKDFKDLDFTSDDVIEEDERFKVLGRIFSSSEVYIFDEGGLPLFASHKPAGQEVCLYTGLFSAIQSMSSDLIGHKPDYLSAGDKQCVFISQTGPSNVQLRGVAIYNSGEEASARKDLYFSMNLVKQLLSEGEPEYAINDRVQSFLVQSFQKGSLESVFNQTIFHAS
ncbi:MAG: hypothetical protein ACTSW1_04090 [Candidatus Hodarchaeales archaeon]